MCDDDIEEEYECDGDVAILSLKSNKLIIRGASYIDILEKFMLVCESHPSLPKPLFSPINCLSVHRGFFTTIPQSKVMADSNSIMSFIRLSRNVFSTSRHLRETKQFGKKPILNNLRASYFPSNQTSDYFESFPWIKLRCYPLLEDSHNWPCEVDPMNSGRTVPTGGDIFFFKSRSDYSNETIQIAIPRGELPIIGEDCFLVGYPAKKNAEEVKAWISTNYTNTLDNRLHPTVEDLKQLLVHEEDNAHYFMEDVKKDIAARVDEFFPHSNRITTVGKVLAYSNGILAVDASSFPGMWSLF